jgi:hypothetical protein
MSNWIEAISTFLGAATGLFAVWQYFFVLDLRASLTVPDTFLCGENSIGGVRNAVLYNCLVTHLRKNDVQIGKLSLQRRQDPWPLWRDVVEIIPDELPHRLPPDCSKLFPITIARTDVGVYRLLVREYGSKKRAKLMLCELSKAPDARPPPA